MFGSMKNYLADQLQKIRDAGLFKGERVITHRYHYADYEKGFAAMRSGNSGKVVWTWKEG